MSASSSPKKPDFGLFIGFIGLLLVFLQMDGVEINWEISAVAYFAIIAGFVWTILVHVVPHYGKLIRLSVSAIVAILLGVLSIFATLRQYHAQRLRASPFQLVFYSIKESQVDHAVTNLLTGAISHYVITNKVPTCQELLSGQTINLGESRQINLGVSVWGDMGLDGLTVELFIVLGRGQPTIAGDNGWTEFGAAAVPEPSIKSVAVLRVMKVQMGQVAPRENNPLPTLHISEPLTNGVYFLPTIIELYSRNIEPQRFKVMFELQKG